MGFADQRNEEFIKLKLDSHVEKHGILEVGNHLNQYFTFTDANDYAQSLAKDGDARVRKSSVDSIMGRLVEDVVVYLLRQYFAYNKCPLAVRLGAQMGADSDIFKLVRREKQHQKEFDVDIVIVNDLAPTKFFLLSVKGSARERIGQYIANLFLMDERVIKAKYGDHYYLEFVQQNIQVKYGFVCFDWGKSPDFLRLTPKTKQPRKTMKQTEVCLINDDEYVAGGLSVLNDHDNLHGILNFGELAAKIAKFLG